MIQSKPYLEDLLIRIILCDHDFVHDRALPFGALIGHGAGLVHMIWQDIVGSHWNRILGVGGTDLIDEIVPILN